MLLDVIERASANDITVSMATNIINMRESARRKRRRGKTPSPIPSTERVPRRRGEGGRGTYKLFYCHLLERPSGAPRGAVGVMRSFANGIFLQNTERALSPSQFMELEAGRSLQVRREHPASLPVQGSY